MGTQGTKPIALISVTNKQNVTSFGQGLVELGYKILSTGGTAKALQEAGVEVTEIADHTKFPEILNGRVKTLHPKVHGGILMDRQNPEHVETAQNQGIEPIDLIVVNLYQFGLEAVDQGLSLEKAIEYIDIGGPTMLRAAAKNYMNTAPVIDPSDYDQILAELKEHGSLKKETRCRLAFKTFATISKYDGDIASYFSKEVGSPTKTLQLSQVQELRYGENPHQTASFQTFDGAQSGLQDARVIQGKELSYNNILDLDAATGIVRDFPNTPCVAIIKHTNPCGVATGKDASLLDIYQKALKVDPKSAFGGIVATNQTIDAETASTMAEIFLECIAAPSFSDEALSIFAKKKNLRLLQVPFLKDIAQDPTPTIRSVQGGLLIQSPDLAYPVKSEWKTVSKLQLSEQESQDLEFAQTVCKHVKSNAIVFAKDGVVLAVGAGQMSRIDSANIAVHKAKEHGHTLEGSVMASDAFFPFRDTVDFAANIGVKAIIQPGGSIKDKDSIDACDEHGIGMVFTGKRHFRH